MCDQATTGKQLRAARVGEKRTKTPRRGCVDMIDWPESCGRAGRRRTNDQHGDPNREHNDSVSICEDGADDGDDLDVT